MEDEQKKREQGEAALAAAALELSYQRIVEWANDRLDEQTPPDAEIVTWSRER